MEPTSRDWETLARSDPLWAVYVRDGTKGGRWDPAEFRQTGAAEVARSWGTLTRLGLEPPHGWALDFGCGVGRLTRPLAQRMDRVVGLDVSSTMVSLAVQECRDLPSATFVISDAPRLPFQDETFGLVYSSLVLQHLPAAAALGYIEEFGRILRPGGIAVFQVATRPRWSPKGVAFRVLPPSVYTHVQRRVLRYPAAMLMTATPSRAVAEVVRRRHGRILAQEPDLTYGGHWHYTRFIVRRD